MPRDLEKYLRDEVSTTAFCPGCGDGIMMGSVLRAVDSLGLDMQKVLYVSGIGCAAWIPSPNFKADTLHTLHGRPVAFATGAKLANPSLEVIVISGDGDLSSIGGNHLIHAARRGIKLAILCANNFIYGMTGGQVASTTPLGRFSATTPPPAGNPYPPFDLVSLVLAAGARFAARWLRTRSIRVRSASLPRYAKNEPGPEGVNAFLAEGITRAQISCTTSSTWWRPTSAGQIRCCRTRISRSGANRS